MCILLLSLKRLQKIQNILRSLDRPQSQFYFVPSWIGETHLRIVKNLAEKSGQIAIKSKLLHLREIDFLVNFHQKVTFIP